jgi:hypothetical protein
MEKSEITLLARTETDEPFKVTFTRDGDKLTITCTCSDGVHGEFCEHKFRLASNDIMMLQYPGQNSEMLTAHTWVIEAPIIEKARAEIGKAMREGTV